MTASTGRPAFLAAIADETELKVKYKHQGLRFIPMVFVERGKVIGLCQHKDYS
jgi:hypothetical protein